MKRPNTTGWLVPMGLVMVGILPSVGLAQSFVAGETVSHTVVLNVDIGEGQIARLLLDTGAQTTTFSNAAARRLGLHTAPDLSTDSLFSGIGTFSSVRIGTQSFNHVSFAVLKLSGSLWSEMKTTHGAVDGSLGLDLLSRCAVGIDVDSGLVTLWPDGRVKEEQASRWFHNTQTLLPVSGAPQKAADRLRALRADLPTGAEIEADASDSAVLWLPPGAAFTDGSNSYRNPVRSAPTVSRIKMDAVNGAPFRLHGMLGDYPFAIDLDTGSSDMTLPPGFTQVIKPLAFVGQTRLSTIDASEIVRGCIYPSVSFGDLSIRYPYAAAAGGGSLYTKTLTAGMSLFEHCKLLIDFPANSFSIARTAPAVDAPRLALADLGVFVVETETGRHTYVGKGSPAERAGMRDYDSLIRTSGLPAAQVDEGVIVMQSEPGSGVNLTAKRRGEPDLLHFDFTASSPAWTDEQKPAEFPNLTREYKGAKRFPNGGVCIDRDRQETQIIQPGGSALWENGRFRVVYRATSTKSFTLNLPHSKYQLIGSRSDPGIPPFVAPGKGAIWIGGVGWVIGETGSRIELDGFSVDIPASPRDRVLPPGIAPEDRQIH